MYVQSGVEVEIPVKAAGGPDWLAARPGWQV